MATVGIKKNFLEKVKYMRKSLVNRITQEGTVNEDENRM